MSKHKLIIALVVVAVSLGGWATLRNGDTPPAVRDTDTQPPGTAGFVATTGDPEAPGAVRVPAGDATSTSQQDLVEVPSRGSGGGVMVDLQGRFQNVSTATLADSDSVVVECLPDSSAGGAR